MTFAGTGGVICWDSCIWYRSESNSPSCMLLTLRGFAFFDVSLVEIHYDVNDKQRCGRKPSWLLIEFYRTDSRITWKSV